MSDRQAEHHLANCVRLGPRVAARLLLERTDAELTLYLRKASRLSSLEGDKRTRLVEGDVLDGATLDAVMTGQDVVYANLSGDMEKPARVIVSAMDTVHSKGPTFCQRWRLRLTQKCGRPDRETYRDNRVRRPEKLGHP